MTTDPKLAILIGRSYRTLSETLNRLRKAAEEDTITPEQWRLGLYHLSQAKISVDVTAHILDLHLSVRPEDG